MRHEGCVGIGFREEHQESGGGIGYQIGIMPVRGDSRAASSDAAVIAHAHASSGDPGRGVAGAPVARSRHVAQESRSLTMKTVLAALALLSATVVSPLVGQ